MEYKIPLRNRKKEIVDYCLVSEEDYDELNKYKWHKDIYVGGTINNKNWRIHRYIIIQILKNDIDSKTFIDHIDNNKMNNKRNNLRIVTISENNRNGSKRLNTTSCYHGVTYAKRDKIWKSHVTINKKQISLFYKNEHHAAYQYNLWCEEFNLTTAKLNIVPNAYINNFIQVKKNEKLSKLPTHITLTKSNKFLLRIKQERIGLYKTLLEAVIIRNFKLKEMENKKKDDILNKPIKRNENNQAIIEIFNKKKEKISETIVDEDIYYDLIKYGWSKSNDYITNRKFGRLHRYIMNYDGDDMIDHINNDPLDNRKENLRIVTAKQNSQNIKFQQNGSSKYIGVYWHQNRWVSRIKHNGETIHLGRFEDEHQAARMRDIATKKYFGEYGNLNFKE